MLSQSNDNETSVTSKLKNFLLHVNGNVLYEEREIQR